MAGVKTVLAVVREDLLCKLSKTTYDDSSRPHWHHHVHCDLTLWCTEKDDWHDIPVWRLWSVNQTKRNQFTKMSLRCCCFQLRSWILQKEREKHKIILGKKCLRSDIKNRYCQRDKYPRTVHRVRERRREGKIRKGKRGRKWGRKMQRGTESWKRKMKVEKTGQGGRQKLLFYFMFFKQPLF